MRTRPKVQSCFTAALIATVVSGCVVGPNYSAPQADVPARWQLAPAPSVQADAPLSQGRFWERFDDPTLNTLVERALKDNLDLKATALRIAIAREQDRASRSAFYPSVSASGLAGRQRQSENGLLSSLGGSSASSGAAAGTSNATSSGAASSTSSSSTSSSASAKGKPSPYSDLYQIGFDATWEPDFWGRVARSAEAARAEVDAQQAARQDAALSLSAEVTRTYLRYRAAGLSLAVLDDQIAAAEDLRRLTASRQSVGFAAQADVAGAEAQRSMLLARRPDLLSQKASLANQLALLVGQMPQSVDDLLSAAPGNGIPELHLASAVGTPAEVLRRRPDIRQSEAQLHEATARIGVATAQLFPQLELGLFGGFQSIAFSKLTDWASRFFATGGMLTVPIFQGGALKANVRIADLSQQQAFLSYRQTVLKAVHETQDAITVVALDTQRLTAEKDAFANAVQAERLTAKRHDQGLASFMDVLTSRRQMDDSKNALVQAQMDIATHQVALFKALGGDVLDDESR